MRSTEIYLALSLLCCASSEAQSKPRNLSGGIFLAIGAENHDTVTQPSAVNIPLVGAYVEWARYAIQPGLDVRGEAGTLGVRGTLVGPRLAYRFRIFHPYAEALFGPNHLEVSPPGKSTSAQPLDRRGITSEVAIGLEADLHPHIRWRVVEFTKGSFSGVSGSRPQSLTTGLVIRLP